MIEHILDDNTEGSFLRHWAERVWDRAQLAQIEAIEDSMTNYAMTAWRSMNIDPPDGVLLLCACEEGVVLMIKQARDWRTRDGVPHKPPAAWMPCPPLPKINGRGRP